MIMTREGFQQQAKDLCDALSRVNRTSGDTLLDWRLESIDDSSFLVHSVSVSRSIATSETDRDEGNEVSFEDSSILQDNESTAKPGRGLLTTFEWRFSVIYSDTWRVPIMYFTVQDVAGNLCSREQVLQMLSNATTQDSWDFLSFDEHPVTGTPSCFLHPCQTEARLEMLMSDKSNSDTLLAWLSMILPAVGHSLSAKTFQEIQQLLL